MSTEQASLKRSQFVERFTRIDDADRSFDLAFWQSQSDAARFEAAWELVVTAHRWKGRNVDELRLQRSVEAFGRVPS